MVGISTAPSKYGSIAVHGKEEPKFYVPHCGLVFYIMAFFGSFCVFALRASLNVAIVAMVNQTAITDDVEMTNTSDEGQCPRDTALRTADGEFNWDRHQQAVLLVAFYSFLLRKSTYYGMVHYNKKLNYRSLSASQNEKLVSR